jgi:hypothetical protein
VWPFFKLPVVIVLQGVWDGCMVQLFSERSEEKNYYDLSALQRLIRTIFLRREASKKMK